MKRIAIILILTSAISCTSQRKEKMDITGDWYNYKNTSAKDITYVETWIDKDSVYTYNDFGGQISSYNYIIEDSILYSKNNKKKGLKIKIIDKNTISLGREDGYIIFKRIVTNGIKLEDFLFKDKSEDDFRVDFNKRKTVWEKARNKEGNTSN